MDSMSVSLLDRRGRIIWSSKQDFDRKRPIFESLHPEDRDQFSEKLSRCIVQGDHLDATVRVALRDSYEWRALKILAVDGVEQTVITVAAVVISHKLPLDPSQLTTADLSVLQLLAADKTIRETAEELDRSESTVDLRIKSLKQALDAKHLHGLVAKAVEYRLVTADAKGAEENGQGSPPSQPLPTG